MTVETRSYIALADILGIEYECSKCKARLFHSIESQDTNRPIICGNCQTPFSPDGSSDGKAIKEFIVSIQDLQRRAAALSRIRLQIENHTA